GRVRELTVGVSGTTSYWTGGVGDRYRAKMTEQVQPYTKLPSPIMSTVSSAATGLASALERAQRQMSAAVQAADSIGLNHPGSTPEMNVSGQYLLLGSVGYGGAGVASGEGQRSRVDASYYVRYGDPDQVQKFMTDHQVDESYFQPVVNQA